MRLASFGLFFLFVSIAVRAGDPAAPAQPPRVEPFTKLMQAARESAAARARAPTVEPVPRVVALPATLEWPRPAPAPARAAVYAHVGPDGRVSYACLPLAADTGEVQR